MDSYPTAWESNVSRLQAQLSDVLSISDVQVLEAPDRVVSFSGHLLRELDSAYPVLRERFQTLGYTPFLRRQGNLEVVVAQQGVILPRPTQVWVNVALFAATALSTLVTGAANEVGVPAMLRQPVLLLTGLPFALTLMSILLAHEMGHYIVGRRYNAPVSLPYFMYHLNKSRVTQVVFHDVPSPSCLARSAIRSASLGI